MVEKANADSKLKGLLSYTLVAAPFLLLKEKKDKYARFHATQATGLLVTALIIRAIIGILQWVTFAPVLWALPFWLILLTGILCAYLAVTAVMGEQKKIPVIDPFADATAGAENFTNDDDLPCNRESNPGCCQGVRHKGRYVDVANDLFRAYIEGVSHIDQIFIDILDTLPKIDGDIAEDDQNGRKHGCHRFQTKP